MKSISKQLAVVDVLNAIPGGLLFASPWLFGFASSNAAAWNAWSAGMLIGVIAFGALLAYAQWQDWANLVLGLWAATSPLTLDFLSSPSATNVHVVVGLVVALSAVLELWVTHNGRLSRAS